MPAPRPHALPRTDLVDRLRAVATPGRLTLLVAGAGWGKTTLVASWARAEPGPTAWFSADATDADPVRFWGAVVAALDGAVPGLGARAADLLGVPGPSAVADVVPVLVDELAALPTPVTLVVDDYHLAGSVEVQRGVTVLATHLPATLRLVLVSRTEPALPLARLRGQGRVAELSADDLRLSAAESAELLAAEAAARATARPSSTRSTPTWPPPSPAGRTRPPCSPGPSASSCSPSRSTTAATGSASTTCSPTCCATTSPAPSPPSCRSCTRGRPDGWPTTSSRSRPSGTRWRATTRRWRPRWWPGTHPCSPASARSRPR